jgi:hypothetical protein
MKFLTEIIFANRVLIGKCKMKRSLGRPIRRWKGDIKTQVMISCAKVKKNSLLHKGSTSWG